MRSLRSKLAGHGRRLALWTAVLAFVALAATGRLGYIVPLAGALFAMLLRLLPALLPLLPHLQRLWRRKSFEEPEEAVVETHFLRMRLNRTTGEIGGEVLAGTLAGRQLYDLSPSELRGLYGELLQADAESARLLGAYLERVMDDGWHTGSDKGSQGSRGAGSSASGGMSRAEALAILGLKDGADRTAIVDAHRRLMQKMHPDRGGSDYLAAKINQAKDVLLRESR
ncbi:MAG: molecular chaperone DnaJ [Methylococcus sp.]|nr:molecular chaperone DnaJ [Methylococcus sp.]